MLVYKKKYKKPKRNIIFWFYFIVSGCVDEDYKQKKLKILSINSYKFHKEIDRYIYYWYFIYLFYFY